MLRDEGIRILAVGERDHAHRHAAGEKDVRGAKAGLLPGRIAVVEKECSPGILREEIRLPFRERGAHRRHNRLQARVHEPDNVEISLDENDALVATDGVARVRQVVQEPPLRENVGFRRVEIFRFARANESTAESDGMRVRVENRKDQPFAKAGPRLVLFLALHEQADLHQPLVGKTEPVQIGTHQAELARGEPQTESIRRLTRDVSLGEILARRRAELALPEHLAEPGGNRGVQLP